MLDFADLPYQWFEPKRNALIARIIRLGNRWRHLPRTKRIAEVRTTGCDRLASLTRRDHVMLVANHPTHADAAIILEATRQVGVWPIFMAAYDVFLRSRLDAFVMQRMGAFSVDREGSDSRAMKQAADTLARGRYALTILPEGNVYLENDRVTPFHDGAAFLAMRLQKQFLDSGNHQTVYAAPFAIKVTSPADIRPQLRQQLEDLARVVEADLTDAPTPLDALRRIGLATLHRNLRARGLEPPATDNLRDIIEYAAGTVLEKLEHKLDVTPSTNDSLTDRVRKVRRVIHEVRTDPDRVADHAAATTWADEAMLAFRIVSYSGQYVAENPTLDRFAETLEKLSEDIHRKMLPPIADRRALVHFSEPIDLRTYLADNVKLRVGVRKLTADLEANVQTSLDHLNAVNDTPGAKRWESW